MYKGYKQRRGLVALLSAFVLVVLLSIPALAVDSSAVADETVYRVRVSGKFYLEDDSVLSNYFILNQSYSVLSGTIDVYQGSSLVQSGCTGIRAQEWSSTGYTLEGVAVDDNNSTARFCASEDATFSDAEFSAYQDRYLLLNSVELLSSSELFAFLSECKSLTSTLIFDSAEIVGNDIVSIIVGGFNGVITGLGSGVADFFQTLFIANDGTGNLSTFAIVSLVFIGVAVAFGIARWIIKKVGQ